MKVNFLTRIERKIEIKTSPKKIYDILNNDELETVWNITVSESTEIAPDKYSIKSTVGDFISTVTERLENERISYSMEGSAFSKMGYILSSKGGESKVSIWAEIIDEKQEKMLEKAGEILLGGLKKFADFLEEGGNPDEFDKKKK
jgi:hypothetical protein